MAGEAIRFDILSDGDVEQVPEATEELLETTGFRVTHPDLLAKARAAGAVVDDADERVRIPQGLLHDLLAQAPDSMTVARQDGTEVVLGEGGPHCHAILTDPWVIDYATQQPRRPALADLRRHTAIAQQLDHVVAVSRMDFPVSDVPEPHSSLRALEEHLLRFGKHHFVYVTSMESFRQWLEIGEILTGSRSLAGSRLFSVAVAIISPLTLAGINGDLLLESCRYDFPIIPTICPMAGSTAPYSLASTLLLGNAENVFLAALSQMVKPGQPFLYTFGPSVTDLQSGHDLYYTTDKVLWKAAAVRLAHSYGLPCSAECGGSLTYRYDQQSGAEGMLFMLSALAAGPEIMAGIGSCHNANGMSAEMMIIQSEWLRAAAHVKRGIPLDDTRLALERLQEAGPGGHFLTDELTLEFMHGGEFFSDGLFDYSGGYVGGPPILERAHERVEELVAGFESPLPGDVQEGLRQFFGEQYR